MASLQKTKNNNMKKTIILILLIIAACHNSIKSNKADVPLEEQVPLNEVKNIWNTHQI